MSAVLAGHELIADERARQVSVEGWTPAHDRTHLRGQLPAAAACYLHYRNRGASPTPNEWPWETSWWKPSDDPIRNLVKAGALIAAEIDRLQGTDPAASLPVEPAGTCLRCKGPLDPGEASVFTVCTPCFNRETDILAAPTASAYDVTEATRSLRAENTELSDRCAALTSEVSRLQKNWDEAYEVHESDKIEIIDLRAEVSALREAVDADKARLDRLEWADCILMCDEEVSDPTRRFSFRDMATPPSPESLDGTLYGPTVRAVLDAALRAARRDGAP